MRYVTGYIGYISQIRWDAGRERQDRASRTWQQNEQGSPLGRGRQAVSQKDPPKVPGTCWQATE